ncbi:MAG: alpha/beta fold hydrolase [Proteobacteria bacterium]|nr:alpha/beta fold hydrolase [Pseudomonadota bacterium]
MDSAVEKPQALLARMDHAARRIETPCGEGTMVWRVWGGGARPPLLLLHGGYGSWRHWIRTIPAFASDRAVVAPDLPGLGESALPSEEPTQAEIAAILRAGLNEVLPRSDAYDLAGFSFGGMIAGHLAAQDGPRVRSLTLVGPGGLGGFPSQVKLEKVISLHGPARVEAHRTNLHRLMIHDPARIDALALAIQDWNTRHGRTKSRPMSRTASLQEVLSHVRAPLHAIYGEFDAPAYPHLAEREARLRAVRPDVDFRIVRGAGHWVAYEAPDTFNALLRRIVDAPD